MYPREKIILFRVPKKVTLRHSTNTQLKSGSQNISGKSPPSWFNLQFGRRRCDHPYKKFPPLQHQIECKNSNFYEGSNCRLKVIITIINQIV